MAFLELAPISFSLFQTRQGSLLATRLTFVPAANLSRLGPPPPRFVVVFDCKTTSKARKAATPRWVQQGAKSTS